MNLLPLHTCEHIHNRVQPHHQTFCKRQAPTMCWALHKVQGTRHESWPQPLGAPRLVVEAALSAGENWSPNRRPGEVLQGRACWWMGLWADGRAGTAGGVGSSRVAVGSRLGGGRVLGQRFLVLHLLDLFLWYLQERQDLGCPPLQVSP